MNTLVQAIGALELTEDLPDGELVMDAIIITRLMHAASGRESFLIAVNKGISTIVQLGLMSAATTVINDGDWSPGGEDL